MAMNVLHSPPQTTRLNKISGYFWRNPGLGLFLLLLGPLMWFGVVYFGSLLTLLWQGFYTFDDFTMSVTPDLTLANLQALFNPANYDIILRTLTMAIAVTIASAILAFPGIHSPGYREVAAMAEEIAAGTSGKALICLEQEMAKALGQALALRLGPNAEILCIDRVKVSEGSYLDVGAPVGPALPVVVKTLVLGK